MRHKTQNDQRIQPEKSQGFFQDHGVQISLVLFILLAITFAFTLIWNVHSVQTALTEVTKHYAQDISLQITADINSKINEQMVSAQDLAENIAQATLEATEKDLQKLLAEKQAATSFKELHLFWEDGHSVSSNGQVKSLFDYKVVLEALDGQKGVDVENSGDLLYAVPVRNLGAVRGRTGIVLVAVRDSEAIRKLLESKSFNEDSWSCILSKRLNIVASAFSKQDVQEKFGQKEGVNAEQIIQKYNEKYKLALEIIKEDIYHNSTGFMRLTNADGNERFLAYNLIPDTEWILMTSMPANLTASITEKFLMKNLQVAVVLIALLLALVVGTFHLFQVYNTRLIKNENTDIITGGHNLKAFKSNFEQMYSNKPKTECTIMLLNVKSFKLINENFGFAVGNNTLKHIYRAVASALKPGEFMCRNESDHFFVCISESNVDSIEKRFAEFEARINSYGRSPIPTDYRISMFAGAYIIANVQSDLTTVLERVRAACEAQRKTGKGGCSFFTHRLRRQMEMEKEINALFELSIENGDFKVYLQPKVRLKDGKLGGAEALVRWMHPQRGLIPPGEFIPLLERSGRICKLDFYVFEQVCIMLNRWIKEGRELVCISVNLSRQHFTNPAFLDAYFDLMQKYEIPSGLIEFELTESIFLDDSQLTVVEKGIDRMHSEGNTCSIDDFGSGYSSMSLLKNIVADTIKLDRAFFTDADNPKADRIIKSMVTLGHNLELTIVAEGIEDKEQMLMLRELNCDMIQGYVFSPPLPIPAFEDWWLNLSNQWNDLMNA